MKNLSVEEPHINATMERCRANKETLVIKTQQRLFLLGKDNDSFNSRNEPMH
jgi:hypothetical protein